MKLLKGGVVHEKDKVKMQLVAFSNFDLNEDHNRQGRSVNER